MNEVERTRTTLITNHEINLARRAYTQRRSEIYANQSAAGRLHSGSTIRAVVALMRETLLSQVASLDEKIRAVVADSDAFALLTAAIEQLFLVFRAELTDVVNMATGGKARGTVEQTTAELYSQAETDTRTELAILAFEYNHASPASSVSSGPRQEPNKGGKPLAAHWDAMWADIAVQLWEGDLKPTKQKDISDAMFAWLNAQELNAGQTAVTDRARALWLLIEPKLRG